MREILEAFLSHDIMKFIELIGLIGVYSVIFAESGLLIGFFLPGDSLLFTAGLLASPGFDLFSIWHLVIGAWIAAVVGDNVGYEFGKRVGRKLFTRKESLLFKPDNMIKAQEFYEKYGGKAIILARFMPIVRTFVPVVAGIGNMDHKKFTLYNFIGGTIWTWGMSWIGFYLGSLIPDVDKYLLPIILFIIFVSFLPPILHLYKENKETWKEKTFKKIKNFIKYGAK
ncbi:DedA family protein [Patescibacteria group bacterium]